MKLFAGFLLSIALVCSAAAQDASALVGKWFEGSASILQEQNTVTGAIASRYGSTIGYTFESDGTFRYAGLIKSTMYGCTTTLWNDRRGTYSVAGDVITFKHKKDYWLNTYSCSLSSNKEQNKPLVTKSFNYEIGVREGRNWLCMREVGKTEQKDIVCYPRSNN
jgi:hypothetical protein